MAIKFTKADQKRLDSAVAAFTVADASASKAVEKYNEIVKTAFAELTNEISVTDEASQELCGVIRDNINSWREEFNGKSEKWQESEKGTAAEAFITKWEEIVEQIPEETDLEEPEGLVLESLDFEWDELPQSPEDM